MLCAVMALEAVEYHLDDNLGIVGQQAVLKAYCPDAPVARYSLDRFKNLYGLRFLEVSLLLLRQVLLPGARATP